MQKSKSKNNYKFYHFARMVVKVMGNLVFDGKFIGKENIPNDGKCILAGNHESNFDAYLLLSSTKREVHFLAKKELIESHLGFIFRLMHIIPIDRKNKNPEAKQAAINILEEDKVIGIFPEGTFHKEDLLLPFKPGVISFAEKTNAPIIPFAIIGKFKFRSKPIIKFGKPIYINEIKDKDKLKYLENVIRDMLTKTDS